MKRAAASLALVISIAACGSRPRPGEALAPKAVVLSRTDRARDSEELARRLHEAGYDVLRKSTTIARPTSSAAVYAVLDHPDRVGEVAKLLDEAGVKAEVLPFPYHASGGNFVVVWLGDDAASDARR